MLTWPLLTSRVRAAAVLSVLLAILAYLQAVPAVDAKPRNGLIAFSAGSCGTFDDECPSRVFVVRPSGGQARSVPCATGSSGRCYDGSPAFSPNGRRLATGTLGSGDEQIAIRSLEGRVLKRVEQRFGINDLGWGGRKSTLAFTDIYQRIVLVSARRSATQRVFRRRGISEVAISREGKLAWTNVDRPGLWVTNRSRTRARRLRAFAFAPVWSPNGRRIAYKNSDGRVMTVGANGKRRRLATNRCNADDFPTGVAWSPDGRQLACSTPRGDLITVRLRTRRTKTVLRNRFPNDIDWQPIPGR